MQDVRERPEFLLEQVKGAGAESKERLDRDAPVSLPVVGFVDDAHSPAADAPHDLVARRSPPRDESLSRAAGCTRASLPLVGTGPPTDGRRPAKRARNYSVRSGPEAAAVCIPRRTKSHKHQVGGGAGYLCLPSSCPPGRKASEEREASVRTAAGAGCHYPAVPGKTPSEPPAGSGARGAASRSAHAVNVSRGLEPAGSDRLGPPSRTVQRFRADRDSCRPRLIVRAAHFYSRYTKTIMRQRCSNIFQ